MRVREQFSWDTETQKEYNRLIIQALSISDKNPDLFQKLINSKRRSLIEKILVSTLPHLRADLEEVRKLLE